MRTFYQVATDKLLLIGWISVVVSAVIFCLPLLQAQNSQLQPGFFMVHYFIAVLYFFMPKLSRGLYNEDHHLHYRIINLVLFLISAYALNRDMVLFATSPFWFSALLTVISISYLVSPFYKLMPEWLKVLCFFIYGIAICVFTYLAIYLLPFYAVSVFGLLAIGISIHCFIPVLFMVYTIRLVSSQVEKQYIRWFGFATGALTTIIICVLFTIKYASQVEHYNSIYLSAQREDLNDLPRWVRLAQQMDDNHISDMALKSGLVYQLPEWKGLPFWNMPSSVNGMEPMHDPLLVIAAYFSPEIMLPQPERIQMLEALYDSRQTSEERLWSGANLSTSFVSTSIRVWPELHLAYTEKLITVHNSNPYTNNQQEAIYILHMPEGAVVTSLSLWIDGKEEKGILTSKSKASTAYNTIVGREVRDPSVVYWQEGNSVSVRVFPVMGNNSRTFKVGITAPLRTDEGRLAYDNTWLEGPDAAHALETVRLEMISEPSSFIRNASFKNEENIFTANRRYRPVWTLHFDDMGLKPGSFSFNDNSYTILPYIKKRVPVDIKEVYLDINTAWEKHEFESVWQSVKNNRVWFYDGVLQELNGQNKDEVFSQLKLLRFSLFPFHLIKDPEHALVVTKSTGFSPSLDDLEGSGFLENLKSGASAGIRMKVFHLGNKYSLYLKSLKEFRMFDWESGTPGLFNDLMRHQKFVGEEESSNKIIIHSADVVIVKTPGTAPSSAPDHLMRLFAYNNIMRQSGISELTGSSEDSVLVAQAREAYVVSPVSSLVVLESQADYDRFDINETDNSLRNASMNNKGAVPEPGEWALIILAVSIILAYVIKLKMF